MNKQEMLKKLADDEFQLSAFGNSRILKINRTFQFLSPTNRHLRLLDLGLVVGYKDRKFIQKKMKMTLKEGIVQGLYIVQKDQQALIHHINFLFLRIRLINPMIITQEQTRQQNIIQNQTSPDKSDLYRKKKSPTVKFGTESRFVRQGMNTLHINPPYYYPKLLDSSPQHSFGIRQTIEDSKSKSIKAGPGSYNLRNHEEGPMWTINQSERKKKNNPIVINETYNVIESLKRQVESTKTTAPAFSFRMKCRQMAIFKQDLARQPITLRIQHPKI